MRIIYLSLGLLFGLAVHSAFATQMNVQGNPTVHETDSFWVTLSIPDTFNGSKVSSATAFASVLMNSDKSCDLSSSSDSANLQGTHSVRMNPGSDHFLSAKTQLVVYTGDCGESAIQPVVRYSLTLDNGKQVFTEMIPITTQVVLNTHSDEEYERAKLKLDRELQSSKPTVSQAQQMSLVVTD